jgi:hypothetical protein
MFYHIAGDFVHIDESFAVIDCAGVGYRLTVSRNTATALGTPGEGRRVKLFTSLQVREDDLELFGFADEAELSAFRLLISVSGVGPKAAMAILSLFNPDQLAIAVFGFPVDDEADDEDDEHDNDDDDHLVFPIHGDNLPFAFRPIGSGEMDLWIT